MATTKKIKVSQKTIDDIKKLGMTKALALAGKNGNPAGGMASEYEEGIRRMYGAKRLAAAKATYAPKAKPAAKPVVKPVPKKAQSTADKLKVIGGTVAAVGLLAASKGKGASAASKLSPAVGKFAKSGVGKALFGTGEKISTKALSTSGRVTAKAGKPVSDSQYNAMKVAAKAKGIKLPTAAKATATKSKAATKVTATKPKKTLTKATIFGASGAYNEKSTTKLKPKTKLKTK